MEIVPKLRKFLDLRTTLLFLLRFGNAARKETLLGPESIAARQLVALAMPAMRASTSRHRQLAQHLA
jgi:hypothetical protein